MARGTFPRYVLRGVLIAAVLVAVFIGVALLVLFYVLPAGWNE